jgi:hypothetical protein
MSGHWPPDNPESVHRFVGLDYRDFMYLRQIPDKGFNLIAQRHDDLPVGVRKDTKDPLGCRNRNQMCGLDRHLASSSHSSAFWVAER